MPSLGDIALLNSSDSGDAASQETVAETAAGEGDDEQVTSVSLLT